MVHLQRISLRIMSLTAFPGSDPSWHCCLYVPENKHVIQRVYALSVRSEILGQNESQLFGSWRLRQETWRVDWSPLQHVLGKFFTFPGLSFHIHREGCKAP